MSNAKICDHCGTIMAIIITNEDIKALIWAAHFPKIVVEEEGEETDPEVEVAGMAMGPLGPMIGVSIKHVKRGSVDHDLKEFCSADCLISGIRTWCLENNLEVTESQ